MIKQIQIRKNHIQSNRSQKFIQVIFGLIITILPAVIASLPHFHQTFIPTHDGEYHIIRFFEFEKNIRNGILFPRWAEGLNSGYGIPLFIFMYPLPNYLGIFFHTLGLSYPEAFEISMVFCYLSAVIFCYAWLYYLTRRTSSSIIGTMLMSLVPYWFLDINIRGSIGEVMALLFVFLSLFLIEKESYILLSLSLGGLILSHNISAMIFMPILAGYAFIRKRSIAPFIFGIIITAYFWIPAIFERKFVTGLNTVDFRDHFPEIYELLIPSWGSGFSSDFSGNKMSFQIGIIPCILLLFTLVKRKNNDNKEVNKILRYFFIIFGISFILMISPSKFIWEAVPLLQLVQYPWRLLTTIIPLIALVGGILFGHSRRSLIIGIFICICSYMAVYSYTRPVEYEQRKDQYYLTKRNFTDGTSSMGNSFSTIWTEWKKNSPKERIEFLQGDGNISLIKEKFLNSTWFVQAGKNAVLRYHTVYFPGWYAKINDQQIPIEYEKNGTIDVHIPEGDTYLSIYYTLTPIEFWSSLLSIIGLSVVLMRSILLIHYDNSI